MWLLRALLLPTLATLAALAVSCDTTPPVDMYFDSSVGADFVAPPRDAEADAPDGGADAADPSPSPSGL
jgi:hypothetical protein